MTHLSEKHFNTYKEGLDLEFLREYCMEHGEKRVMVRGETLEEAGEPAQWVAYVERGCFKYMVHNDEEGKELIKSKKMEQQIKLLLERMNALERRMEKN